MVLVFKLDPINPERDLLKIAARYLKEGKLVAFPTETVYGLGADAFNYEAVEKIFLAKNRPSDNPLIVHVSSIEQAEEIAVFDEKSYRLAEKFWPGPLTLVLPLAKELPKNVTAGLKTVAIRVPAHPVALGLIEESGPIAAPSANISGRPSPTKAEHVVEDLGSKVDLILDAGETIYGLESTIVDMLNLTLLRPGACEVEEIEKIIGSKLNKPSFTFGFEAEEAIAPGMKYRHYSPNKPLLLVEGKIECVVGEIRNISKRFAKEGKKFVVIASKETANEYDGEVFVVGSRENLFEVAKNLFDVLRKFDRSDAEIAIAESYEERGLGFAIMNRLRKAASRIIKL